MQSFSCTDPRGRSLCRAAYLEDENLRNDLENELSLALATMGLLRRDERFDLHEMSTFDVVGPSALLQGSYNSRMAALERRNAGSRARSSRQSSTLSAEPDFEKLRRETLNVEHVAFMRS